MVHWKDADTSYADVFRLRYVEARDSMVYKAMMVKHKAENE